MKFNFIEKVVFGSLRDEHERRGVIAVFHAVDVPNKEFQREKVVDVIQRISGLLGRSFNTPQSGLHSGKEGEQNDSWIYKTSRDECAVRLLHKYWSSEQIVAFKEIVRVMAKLHNWEVVEAEALVA